MITKLRGLSKPNYEIYRQAVDGDSERAELKWTNRKIVLIESLLSRKAPLRVIGDFGCRSGAEAARYGKAARAKEVHGFEIASAPLQIAAARGIIPHEWISGETPCPVEDNFLDAMVAGDIIEHLFDTDIFLQELHRVLKSNGILLVTTPNLMWWWNRLRFLFGQLPVGFPPVSDTFSQDGAIDPKHLRVNKMQEWRALFAKHGFDCLETIGFNYPMPMRLPFGRTLDDFSVRWPTLAHSLLFVLKKSPALYHPAV